MDTLITRLGGSFCRLVAVTPSAADISPPLQAIYVGTSGDLVVENSNGHVVTLENAVGWHFIEIRKVLETTSATGLVGAS